MCKIHLVGQLTDKKKNDEQRVLGSVNVSHRIKGTVVIEHVLDASTFRYTSIPRLYLLCVDADNGLTDAVKSVGYTDPFFLCVF